MPWFVIECERKTVMKYLVKAESSAAVMDACDDWEYFGYVDGDEEGEKVSGPFDSKETALGDVVAFIEG
jgi:hypothetical protein